MRQNSPHSDIANTMISDKFEVFHVQDTIVTGKTLYHYHDFYEIHCTLSGSAIFFLDGEEYILTPGNILLIHYNDLHRVIRQTSQLFERTYIFVTSSYLTAHSTQNSALENCFKSSGQPQSYVLKSDVDDIHYYLSLLNAQPADEFGADLLYEQSFIQFMIYLNQLISKEEVIVQPNKNVKSELIQELMAYVSDNLQKELSLDAMAEAFHYSKFYISREFKRQTGITFHQYVVKKRLLYSKHLLRQNKSSVNIFKQCGFNSYTHFLRSFKNEFGMTPKEFIKHDKENTFIRFDHH